MEVDEILAALQAIIDAASGRSLTEEEVTNYERLEGLLAQATKTAELRKRNTAYNTVTGAHLHVGTAKPDNGLMTAFNAYLRTGHPNADIAALRVTNEQSVGVSTAGGYTVPEEFRQKMVEVMQAYGGLADVTDSFSTATGAPLEYPSLDDTDNQGAITAENATVADGQDLTFGTVQFDAYKYTSAGAGTGLPLRVSVELLQDSAFDIAGLISRAMGTRIARKQAQHWCTGTGVSQPKGIVAPSLTANETLDVSDTIDYDDILDTEAALDPAYEQNAVWVMNKATWTAIRAVVDGAGRPIVMPQSSSGIGTAPAKELLGYRVVIDQGMPNLVDTAAYFAVLGDMREAYAIRRVSSMVVVANPYNRAAQGQIEYTAWERADGNIQNRSAYVILRNV